MVSVVADALALFNSSIVLCVSQKRTFCADDFTRGYPILDLASS